MLGAFGAHALENQLPEQHLIWWQKGVSYQGLHTLAILMVGLLGLYHPSKLLHLAGWCYLTGTLLFSGSLYLLALTDIRPLGMLTPFGGLGFIVGWFLLALTAWRLQIKS
jgi:uncharacterized membrane protein YgdD (TMEM256/DUF423 family)